jgi:hypothetical protein
MFCKSAIFPAPSQLGQRITPISYYLLGDDAFSLDVNLMKPYPYRSAIGDEKVFNYRLSRARRIVENAIGLLCARCRVLLHTIELDVPNVLKVVQACMPSGYIDKEDEFGNVTPGNWRDEVDGNVRM